MGVAGCVGELGVILQHIPLTLWQGQKGEGPCHALRTLVEKGCNQMMLLTLKHTSPNIVTPLSIAALLLTSRCCEVLLRLQPHLLPSTLLPQWPLQLQPSPTHHDHTFLPKEWVGKDWLSSHPAMTVLLVSGGSGECCGSDVSLLQKDLAIQQFLFDTGSGHCHDEGILDFVFDCGVDMECCAGMWNGQVRVGVVLKGRD